MTATTDPVAALAAMADAAADGATGDVIVLASIRTPRDVADWLATGPAMAEKDAMHGALHRSIGWEATVRLWLAGHDIHRRRRSTCKAAREAWAITAINADQDGHVVCPGCEDLVATTPDPVCRGLVVIAAHRYQETS